jgi:hypothetical protein
MGELRDGAESLNYSTGRMTSRLTHSLFHSLVREFKGSQPPPKILHGLDPKLTQENVIFCFPSDNFSRSFMYVYI